MVNPNEQAQFCEQCGQPLQPGVRFCKTCGSTVPGVPINPPPRQPAPSHQPQTQLRQAINPPPVYQTPPPSPPAVVETKGPSKGLLFGAGCLVVLCLVVSAAVLGIVIIKPDWIIQRLPMENVPPQSSAPVSTPIPPTYEPLPEDAGDAPTEIEEPPSNEDTPDSEEVEPVEEPPVEEPAVEAPEEEPVIEDPTTVDAPEEPLPDSGLTGDQYIDETYLYDDFSSQAFDWMYGDDVTASYFLDNEEYAILTEVPFDYVFSFIPVGFNAGNAKFAARVPMNQQDGYFGVICHFEDFMHYSYVKFDVVMKSYAIGEVLEGEEVSLTDDYWNLGLSFNQQFAVFNTYQVECLPDSISLFINDEWAASVDVPWVNYEMVLYDLAGFFIETNETIGAGGFQVNFDNVEIWESIQ